jgi:hypothetical protein
LLHTPAGIESHALGGVYIRTEALDIPVWDIAGSFGLLAEWYRALLMTHLYIKSLIVYITIYNFIIILKPVVIYFIA